MNAVVHLVLALAASIALFVTAESPLNGRKWAVAEHVLFWLAVVNLPLALMAAAWVPG